MRKGAAIIMTQKLLSRVDPGPRIVAQKCTPEALIDALRIIRSDEQDKLLKESCGGIVIAEELVSFLNKDTYERGLGTLLIELWNCADKFEYRTRNRPVEELHYSHLTLLGATTVHNLRGAIPIQAMGDGFTSRVLFVYVDQMPTPVPRPRQSAAFRRTQEELIRHLQSLSSLQGEVTFTPDAERFFDEEYEEYFYESTKMDPQFHAYASRRDKHLLKVAMCLMAAEGSGNLFLDVHHLQGAKVALEDLEAELPTVFNRIIMTETGSMTDRVLRTIQAAPEGAITRSELQRRFSHQMNAFELGKIIQTLTQSRQIRLDTIGGELMYKAIKGPS